jgi:hypothetical protein
MSRTIFMTGSLVFFVAGFSPCGRKTSYKR